MPGYPPLARTVRVQGIQTVKVFLSEQATAQTVESGFEARATAMEKAFKDSAEKALKNSRFSKACGGKTITLIRSEVLLGSAGEVYEPRPQECWRGFSKSAELERVQFTASIIRCDS